MEQILKTELTKEIAQRITRAKEVTGHNYIFNQNQGLHTLYNVLNANGDISM